VLDTDSLVTEDADYTSLAGFLLARFETLPEAGQAIERRRTALRDPRGREPPHRAGLDPPPRSARRNPGRLRRYRATDLFKEKP
jgi:hypothetical protein